MTNRQIDKLIAVKIQGWSVHSDGDTYDDEGHHRGRHGYPHYSEEIEDAFQLLQSFPEMMLYKYDTRAKSKRYSCSLSVKGVYLSGPFSYAATPELAICRAALAHEGINHVKYKVS